MKLPHHWWRTADGRLVPHGDPDSAVLAYPAETEIPDEVAVKLGFMPAPEPEPEPEPELQASVEEPSAPDVDDAEPARAGKARPADKAAKAPANKAASTSEG